LSKQVECQYEEGPLGRRIIVPKGLDNVIVDVTNISGVDPTGKATIYRGYTIEDIGEHADFYEAAFLIHYGHLPNESEYKEFKNKLDSYRAQIPEKLIDALKLVPATHPMYYAQFAYNLLGQFFAPEWPQKASFEFLEEHAMRLIALTPFIFAAAWHLPRDGILLRPDPSLPHAKDALRMILGRMPTDMEARAFEATLVLYMDHGFNASTFTVRVAASTLTDIYSAAAAGVASLKGPLHGGANEQAIKWLLEAKAQAESKGVPFDQYVEQYILDKLAKKELIMGFGHRVYKIHDPRTDVAKKFILQFKDGEMWVKVLAKAEEVMWREKKLPANIDLYTGVLYYQLGIPVPMYTPIFAMGRIVGWTAHYIEQFLNNRIIRPDEKYIGPTGLKYVPIDQRK